MSAVVAAQEAEMERTGRRRRRRIGIWNQKGGVGKSTLATNLAHALTLFRRRRVLLVDTEKQGNATGPLLDGREPAATLYDVLYGKATALEAALEVRPNLDIIAADATLDEAEEYVELQMMKGHGLYLLRDAMADVPHDYVVYDMGPGITAISKATLFDVEELVLPVELEPFAMEAVREVLGWLEKWQRVAHHPTGIRLVQVVPTKLDLRRSESKPYLEALQRRFAAAGLLAEPIPVDANIPHSQDAKQTLFEHSGLRAKSAKAIAAVAERLDEADQ